MFLHYVLCPDVEASAKNYLLSRKRAKFLTSHKIFNVTKPLKTPTDAINVNAKSCGIIFFTIFSDRD